MVFAPPQSGKSLLVSVHLPAYWLGRRPDDPIILASYAASLAESKSRQARRIVESKEYKVIFPEIETNRGSRAVDHWDIANHRGGMIAAGVGGGITGFGSLLGVIDDPVENWQESQSETVRNTVWEWYRTTFRTRVWENGSIILVTTRWSEDDLAGRLLEDNPGEWKVLRLPAIAETQEERDSNNEHLGLPIGEADPLNRQPGEPLSPLRFSLAALEALRRDVGSMAWASQYQGVPRAPEGNRFKRKWFKIIEEMPKAIVVGRVRYWDQAGTEDGGDYTVGVLMAKTNEGSFVVEDVVRGQWSSGTRDNVMLATAEQDRLTYGDVRIWVEAEPGSGGKESAEAKVRLLAGFPIFTERVTDSKAVRCEPFAAQAEGGNVYVLKEDWTRDYIEEVISYPNGNHDDQVDASSGAFNKLAVVSVWTRPGVMKKSLIPMPWDRKQARREMFGRQSTRD